MTVQINADERGRYREKVNNRINVKPEPEFVFGCHKSDKEVDHEKEIESQIDLLR
jgi:hypothetical protein